MSDPKATREPVCPRQSGSRSSLQVVRLARGQTWASALRLAPGNDQDEVVMVLPRASRLSPRRARTTHWPPVICGHNILSGPPSSLWSLAEPPRSTAPASGHPRAGGCPNAGRLVSGRRRRGRRRRCRWRAGRARLGPGRSAWWCADRRAMPPLGRLGAGRRRRGRR